MGDIGRSVQAGASIADAAISAGATMSAAGTEADAAKYGANLQSQAAANSLDFTKQQYATTQQQQAPYIAAGQGAINNLAKETAPGGSLNTPYSQTFNAPAPFSFTQADLPNDPAYNFDLAQGQQAIQRSAAASGGVLSAGTQKDLVGYTQGMASNQFQQSYANAFNTYQQNYSNALQNYNTAYNVWGNNQANSYNRQAAVAGIGQTSVGQLGAAGAQASNTVSNTAATGASGAANYLTQGATASAAGLLGVSNAAQSGINSGINAFNSSSYGGSGQYSAGSQIYAPVSQSQWNAYDAGSTPGGEEDITD